MKGAQSLTFKEVLFDDTEEETMDVQQKRLQSYKKKLIKPLQFNTKVKRKLEMGIQDAEKIAKTSHQDYFDHKAEMNKMFESLKELQAISKAHDQTAGFVKKPRKLKRKKTTTAGNPLKQNLKSHLYDYIQNSNLRYDQMATGRKEEVLKHYEIEDPLIEMDTSPRPRNFGVEMATEGYQKAKLVRKLMSKEASYKNAKRKMLLFRGQLAVQDTGLDDFQKTYDSAKGSKTARNLIALSGTNRRQSQEQIGNAQESKTMNELPSFGQRAHSHASLHTKIPAAPSQKKPYLSHIRGAEPQEPKRETNDLLPPRQNSKPALKTPRIPLEKLNQQESGNAIKLVPHPPVAQETTERTPAKRISFSPYKTVQDLRNENRKKSNDLHEVRFTEIDSGSKNDFMSSYMQNLHDKNFSNQPSILRNNSHSNIGYPSNSHHKLTPNTSKTQQQIDFRQNLLGNIESAKQRVASEKAKRATPDRLKYMLESPSGFQEDFGGYSRDSSRRRGRQSPGMGESNRSLNRTSLSQRRTPEQERDDQVSKLFQQLVERKKKNNEFDEHTDLKQMHKQIKNLIKMEYDQSNEDVEELKNPQSNIYKEMGYSNQSPIHSMISRKAKHELRETGTIKGAQNLNKKSKITQLFNKVQRKKTTVRRVA